MRRNIKIWGRDAFWVAASLVVGLDRALSPVNAE